MSDALPVVIEGFTIYHSPNAYLARFCCGGRWRTAVNDELTCFP